jgi:hypothetical protein
MKALVSVVSFLGALLCLDVGAQVPYSFTAKSGYTYRVQSNTTLSRFWQESSVISNTAGTVSLSLPYIGEMGFYRAIAADGPTFWYDWTWNAQKPTLSAWGMGKNQMAYVHNDRPYEWYVDQGSTGPDSRVNCGPSSTVMACKWYNSNSLVTAEEARNTYPEGNGWWYTTNVEDYLSLQGVTWEESWPTNVTLELVTNTLARGNIIIFCLDMAYVSETNNLSARVHGFYSGVTGHCIVAKGYRVTNAGTWIECYDPNSLGATYSDGTPKGRNRHYAWTELNPAITNWWPDCIIVSPPSVGIHLVLQSHKPSGPPPARMQ